MKVPLPYTFFQSELRLRLAEGLKELQWANVNTFCCQKLFIGGSRQTIATSFECRKHLVNVLA